ncbi:MAG: protein kinase [Xanthomonadales bacterium]|nr:protein kinase [Xanthomonadales bacterium]
MDLPSTLRALYEGALAQPERDRPDWLARHCPDPRLRERVLAMLCDPTRSDPLALSLGERMEALATGPVAIALPSGGRIGPFELVDILGQGGFATVYRGVREVEGVRQEVAIKLLHCGLHSADSQRQFRREQRALAQLRHPHIARLVEGGITGAGLPYIALELVEGERITDHVRRARCGLEARLELFLNVCEAVEAAHRALIVHRDLKPANVLVTTDGHVKLLDFGIAKLLDEVEEDATRTGHQPFTPAYAAPEQRLGTQVTTATDVYALGVLLGELVSGQRLNDGRAATPASYISGNEEPGVLPEAAAIMRRRLRGDLGAIVQKALAEEPERRYASAAGLAADVRHLLAARPVTARRQTRWYHARRFVQRNRGVVVLALAFMLALAGAFAAVLWQARVARFEAARANGTREFLLQVFAAARPAGPRLAPPTVADVVSAGIVEAQQSTLLQPRVRISLVSALGEVLAGQGEHARSVELLGSNVAAAETLLPVADPVRIEAGLALARAEQAAGRRGAARARTDALLADAAAGDDLRAGLLAFSAQLGAELFERERALRESAAAVRLCTACAPPTRVRVLLARGDVLAAFQEDPAARQPLEEALALQRAIHGDRHLAVAETLQRLSRHARRRGDLTAADALAREAVAVAEASVPAPHRARAEALDTLWQVLIDANRNEEARVLGEQVVAMDEATLGSAHPALATSKNTLAFVQQRLGNRDAAIAGYREALAISMQWPENVRRTATYKSNLGGELAAGGAVQEGLQLLHEALADLRGMADPDHGEICAALEKLGGLQLQHGDAAGALASFSASDALYRTRIPDAPPAWRVHSLVGLGLAMAATGDAAGATLQLREAVRRIDAVDGIPFHTRAQARAGLALQLAAAGELDEARVLARQAAHDRRAAPAIGATTAALMQRIEPLLVD